ncbi:hypothetical protein DO97_08065 [Neosynechococcus sphagnicola sy1]|uniref:Uncharacterized protein n=1 Tax=Neosynechococcus sphagnicola sy1 TaxID=1497020 RepID=A0A098TNT9_9CYAN|nr:DUF190 domain-containing protein [Neosynechococcus sphagnicola]KGF72498.1 hypothetical protein DO97_08065 [Neosynechococcus sphagnicola sy1]
METWEKLTIHITEVDQWHGKPLHTAIVEAAQKHHLSGASVFRGMEGYGLRDHHTIHTARMFEMASALPILVILIDQAEAIAAFLPIVQEMVTAGLVIQETVNVVHRVPKSTATA